MAQCGTNAGCQEQWTPAVLVHDERERHARDNYEHSEYHGAGVRRQTRVGQHRRGVRFHHARTAGHLQHGQRHYDDQRDAVPVQQVCQFSLLSGEKTKTIYESFNTVLYHNRLTILSSIIILCRVIRIIYAVYVYI